jgi:uncharacterized protein (TIGR00290 family)
MLEKGHQAVALLVMINEAANRSFFHGSDYELLDGISEALHIPMILCKTKGEDYHLAMEEGLRKAKSMGAEAACFGDIDIEGNRQWSVKRCQNVGLKSLFPLWQKGREEAVKELVALGYRSLIKIVNTKYLPVSILGRPVDKETIEIMKDNGIDICGENGEYHTLTVDGPIFYEPLSYRVGEVFEKDDYAYIDIGLEG